LFSLSRGAQYSLKITNHNVLATSWISRRRVHAVCVFLLPVPVDIRRTIPSACQSWRIAKCNFSLDSLDIKKMSKSFPSKGCSFLLRKGYFAHDISGLGCSRSSRGLFSIDSGVAQGGPQTLLYLNHFRALATTISGGSVVTLSAPALGNFAILVYTSMRIHMLCY